MKHFFFALTVFALVFVSGCAFFRQAAEDYRTGMTTPLEIGEVAPAEKARVLASTVSAIPYVNLSSPLVLFLGTYVFGLLRGRRIRAAKPINVNPVTGSLGRSLGLEAVVQHFADIAAGLFEIGPNGSSLKRGWKAALLTGIAISIAPEARHLLESFIPALQANPPEWLAHLFNGSALALTVGALSTAEKWLSKVQPLPADPVRAVSPLPDA